MPMCSSTSYQVILECHYIVDGKMCQDIEDKVL
jgi:hypothetical protein